MTPEQALAALLGSQKAVELAIVGAARGIESALWVLVSLKAFEVAHRLTWELAALVKRRRADERALVGWPPPLPPRRRKR